VRAEPTRAGSAFFWGARCTRSYQTAVPEILERLELKRLVIHEVGEHGESADWLELRDHVPCALDRDKVEVLRWRWM
jgi:hypothetical protein